MLVRLRDLPEGSDMVFHSHTYIEFHRHIFDSVPISIPHIFIPYYMYITYEFNTEYIDIMAISTRRRPRTYEP